MQVPLNTYPDLLNGDRVSLTIGVFDGVHLGHQQLIRETTAISRVNAGWVSAALTFNPHPASFFGAKIPPYLIDTFEERVDLLGRYGIDRVIVAAFDAEFARATAEDFVRRILIDQLNVGAVIVGEDFHYGRDRGGDVATLRAAGAALGFSVIAVPQVYVGSVPVRSSEIRARIESGAVDEVAELLGRPFALHGQIVRGKQLGRTIGFPTANLSSDPAVIAPGPGIYAGRAYVGNEAFRAAISVGNNPTVAPEGVTLPQTVEAYLLDGFERDIYGSFMKLEFQARLRGMQKFDGLPALIGQMRADVDEVLRRVS